MDRADEIAREVAQIGFKAVHLTEMPADDPGGCEGCEKGWCQSAVDAICDGRSQFEQAVIPAIAAALRDFAKEERERCASKLACNVTGHPCGTDTYPVGCECHCQPCNIAAKIREDGKEKP